MLTSTEKLIRYNEKRSSDLYIPDCNPALIPNNVLPLALLQISGLPFSVIALKAIALCTHEFLL